MEAEVRPACAIHVFFQEYGAPNMLNVWREFMCNENKSTRHKSYSKMRPINRSKYKGNIPWYGFKLKTSRSNKSNLNQMN